MVSYLLHSHRTASTLFPALQTRQSESGIQRPEMMLLGRSRDTPIASTPSHSHRTVSASFLALRTRQSESGMQRTGVLL
jgi:hypothetical protein